MKRALDGATSAAQQAIRLLLAGLPLLLWHVPCGTAASRAKEPCDGVAVSIGQAQEAEQETLKANLALKLESEFLKKAPWFTDYEKAREEAKAGSKLIVAYFTRSYESSQPSVALETGALSDARFVAWAKDYVLFCHITSYVKGEKHPHLLTQTGGVGFPFVAILGSDGGVLARHAAPRVLEGFAQAVEKARLFLDLKKKAAEGDKSARHDWFLQAVDLGHFAADDARKMSAENGLTAAEQARLDARCIELEFTETICTVTDDKETRIAAGRRFADMKRQGRLPKSDAAFQPFWILMMEFAESRSDATLYEDGLNAIREKFASQAATPKYKEWMGAREEILKRLKTEKK